MKEKITIIFLVILMTLTACSQPNIPEENEPEGIHNQSRDNFDSQAIDLVFSTISKEKLEEGQPKEEWVKAKSIYFGRLPNQIEATVHLYLENIGDSLEKNAGAVYAFLEHEGKTYDLRDVGGYGLRNVSVELEDMNFDGIKEVVISGGMGSNYVGKTIIEYDQNNQEWVILLSTANLQSIDLDGDGQEELVSISYGSMPGRVSIYRWNQDHFERVSIAEATGNGYAYLHNEEGKWIIESGRFSNGEMEDARYYRYKSGKLIEQDRRD